MEFSLLPEPPKVTLVSPSRIDTYQNCPKEHYFQYVLELSGTGEVKGYFNKGNYAHELMHVYYELLKAGAKPGSPYTQAYIRERISNDLKLLLDSTTIGNRSLARVIALIGTRIERYIREQSPKIDGGMEVKGVEYELIWPLNETTVFRGFADLIYRDSTGRLRVRDHKSGEKAWSTADADNSEQLLDYATIIYKHTGEIPLGEISYINTKEYARGKEPTYQQAYAFVHTTFSAAELDYHYDVLCRKVSEMLSSSPVPHYAPRCGYCIYQGPCFAERKGIDPTPIIKANFVQKPREGLRKHASFTEAYSSGNSDFH